MRRSPRFQVGGALRQDALYVPRPADVELYRRLLAGEFCYVLAPRQMGKSSLRYRVSDQLAGDQLRSVHVDLTGLGTSGERDAWHLALLESIGDELQLEDPLPEWNALAHLPTIQRWLRILRRWMEQEIKGSVVVFIDEIDAVRALPFPTEDLFSAIRSIYNERPGLECWRRLTFCLSGVARPTELIRDPRRTPFNIGRLVRLEDFTAAEAGAFVEGLASHGASASTWLDEVLAWTSGHPYMTQRLCEAVAGLDPQLDPAPAVADAVRRLFLYEGEHSDVNLQSAAQQVRNNAAQRDALVALYRRVLTGADVPAADSDELIASLLLTGMVARRSVANRTLLRVRNRVFAEVFNLAWVEQLESRRPFTVELMAWLSTQAPEGTAVERDPHDLLLRGEALECATRWAERRLDVSPEERDYLLESQGMARREHERHAAEALLLRTEAERGRQEAETRRMQAELKRLEETRRRQEIEGERLIERARTSADREALQRRYIRILGAILLGLVVALGVVGRLLVVVQRAEAELSRRVQSEGGMRATLLAQTPQMQFSAIGASLQAIGLPTDMHPTPESITGFYDGLWTQPVVTPDRELWASDARTKLSAPGRYGDQIAAVDAEGRVLLGQIGGRALIPIFDGDVMNQLAVISPDGRTLVVGDANGRILAWRVDEPLAEPRVLITLNKTLSRLQFSPSGDQFLVTWSEPSAWTVDLATGQVLQRLPHSCNLTQARYSPDGARIATSCVTGEMALWSADTGQRLNSWRGDTERVQDIAWSPDGERIASVGADARTRLWTRDGTPVESPRGRMPMGGWHVAFAPGGRHLVAAGQGGGLLLWDLATGDAPARRLTALGEWITSPRFTADGRRLLAVSTTGNLAVWDAASAELQALLVGHRGPVLSAAFSSQGDAVVSSGGDGRVLHWTLPPSRVCGCAAQNVPGDVAASEAVGARPLWVTARGATTTCGDAVLTYGLDATLLGSWTPTGACLVDLVASPDGRMVTVDEAGVVVGRVSPTQEARFTLDAEPTALRPRLLLSPQGVEVLIVRGPDSPLRAWSLDTGAMRRIVTPTDWDGQATWGPDGQHLLLGTAPGPMVWTDLQGEVLQTLRLDPVTGRVVRFSPDGDRVVIAGQDGQGGSIALWEPATRRSADTWRTGAWQNKGAVWDHAGCRFAVFLDGEGVNIYMPGQQKPAAALEIRGRTAASMAFDQTGTRLLMVMRDGRSELWDIDTQKRIASPDQSRFVSSATFSPDGDAIYTVDESAVIRRWSLDLAANVQRACTLLATRELDETTSAICAAWASTP